MMTVTAVWFRFWFARKHVLEGCQRPMLMGPLGRLAWLPLLMLMGSILSHSPEVHANEVCDVPAFESEAINTSDGIDEDGITVIGHLPEHNYVVVVPGRRDSLLITVRRYVPDAFSTSSRLGAYVHAGAFETRGKAEILSMRLRACKIRSRVVYFRNGRPV